MKRRYIGHRMQAAQRIGPIALVAYSTRARAAYKRARCFGCGLLHHTTGIEQAGRLHQHGKQKHHDGKHKGGLNTGLTCFFTRHVHGLSNLLTRYVHGLSSLLTRQPCALTNLLARRLCALAKLLKQCLNNSAQLPSQRPNKLTQPLDQRPSTRQCP